MIATPPTTIDQPPAATKPTPASSGLRDAVRALAMLGTLVVLGALAIAPYVPMGVVPASAAADVFSAERALPHLRISTEEPRPVGSPANARVRDYLLAQISALGLRPEIQRAAMFRAPTGDG